MKKNLFKIALLFGATMFFSACGGGGDKLSMTPETTKISGQLADCFEVVDGECSVALKDGEVERGAVWNIKVRRTEAPLPFNEGVNLCSYASFRTDGQYYQVGFGLTVTDANGSVVRTVAPTELPYSSEDIENILKLKPGEEGVIRWRLEDEENNLDATLKFKLSSAYELQGEAAAPQADMSFDLENVLLPSQIKDKVEVISAQKHMTRTGYPAITIAFKLLEKVNTAPMSTRYGQMWIVGVGQTEEGVDVMGILPSYKEWRTRDSEGSIFKSFLESEPGETVTLEFTGSNNSEDVKGDLAQVKKFKLKITHP